MSCELKKQQGAVLVITLVILAVITLISVSELNQAGQQVKMITNVQQRDLSFQAAESAMSEAMSKISKQESDTEQNIVAMSQSINSPNGAPISITNTTMTTSDMNVNMAFKAAPANVLRSRNSITADENDPTVRHFNFTATSTATITDTGAKTTIVQGFTYE